MRRGPPFQSTHPSRGATFKSLQRGQENGISIHAPLTGCDSAHRAPPQPSPYFNPRTPHGVRLGAADNTLTLKYQFQSTHPSRGATIISTGQAPELIFQSTHPSRGATLLIHHQTKSVLISIHAPLTGCDILYHTSRKVQVDFNPRTPHGVRPYLWTLPWC